MGHAFAKIAQQVASAVLESSLVVFVAQDCMLTINRLSEDLRCWQVQRRGRLVNDQPVQTVSIRYLLIRHRCRE